MRPSLEVYQRTEPKKIPWLCFLVVLSSIIFIKLVGQYFITMRNCIFRFNNIICSNWHLGSLTDENMHFWIIFDYGKGVRGSETVRIFKLINYVQFSQSRKIGGNIKNSKSSDISPINWDQSVWIELESERCLKKWNFGKLFYSDLCSKLEWDQPIKLLNRNTKPTHVKDQPSFMNAEDLWYFFLLLRRSIPKTERQTNVYN